MPLVRSELGLQKIAGWIHTRIVNFWCRMNNQPEKRPPRMCMEEQRSIEVGNYWWPSLVKLLQNSGFSSQVLNPRVNNSRSFFTQRVLDINMQSGLADLANSATTKWLSRSKCCHHLKKYLTFPMKRDEKPSPDCTSNKQTPWWLYGIPGHKWHHKKLSTT